MKGISQALITSYQFEGIGCTQSVDMIYESEKFLAEAIKKRVE